MKSIRRLVVSLVAFGAVCAFAGIAAADYACSITHRPGSTSSFGSNGYATVTTYSSPNCGGSFLSTLYLCTSGATSTSCISSATYRFTEASLLAHVQMVRQAVVDGGRLQVWTSTCQGGSGACLAYFQYYAP